MFCIVILDLKRIMTSPVRTSVDIFVDEMRLFKECVISVDSRCCALIFLHSFSSKLKKRYSRVFVTFGSKVYPLYIRLSSNLSLAIHKFVAPKINQDI